MFRCDWCENYRDTSECIEDPTDPCGSACEECIDEHDANKEEEKVIC